ncbi:hypothetical protein HYW19_00285 [Candidatus Woesearchaeota archaeon]|nr:hypothetical protein [Candidatus Woesearchaeota archaeon]
MKKMVLVLVFLITLVFGCQPQVQWDETKLKNDVLQAGEGLPVEVRSLSDIQIAACETADEAGTCDTRLAEIGIVLKEECCEILNKCCQ